MAKNDRTSSPGSIGPVTLPHDLESPCSTGTTLGAALKARTLVRIVSHRECIQVREDHANTEQQFKTLYRSKYLPLKEEVQECRQDIARLKACRAADAEACVMWRAQVR